MKNKRNWGKEIKDVGVLIIIVGIVMLILGIVSFFSTDRNSPLYILFANPKSFLILIVGGFSAILIGIVVRSIGKSKEIKFNEQQSNENK